MVLSIELPASVYHVTNKGDCHEKGCHVEQQQVHHYKVLLLQLCVYIDWIHIVDLVIDLVEALHKEHERGDLHHHQQCTGHVG